MKELEKLSNDLAREICDRIILEPGELSALIKTRVERSLLEIMEGQCRKEERIYLNLLSKQSKTRKGSPEYTEIAYMLSRAKHNRAMANRAFDNIRKKQSIKRILSFIEEKYGVDARKDACIYLHN